jgi:hypothetical protein
MRTCGVGIGRPYPSKRGGRNAIKRRGAIGAKSSRILKGAQVVRGFIEPGKRWLLVRIAKGARYSCGPLCDFVSNILTGVAACAAQEFAKAIHVGEHRVIAARRAVQLREVASPMEELHQSLDRISVLKHRRHRLAKDVRVRPSLGAHATQVGTKPIQFKALVSTVGDF